MSLLREHGVELKSEVTLTEITADAASVVDGFGEKVRLPADTVVLALGMKPLSEQARDFQGLAPETYTIGDCMSARDVMAAVHGGFNATADL